MIFHTIKAYNIKRGFDILNFANLGDFIKKLKEIYGNRLGREPYCVIEFEE